MSFVYYKNMFALIILVVFGLGIAYFATQNTGLVHLMVGNYMLAGVPLYMVIIGAVLLGIFISWIISMVDSLSSLLRIQGKDAAIKEERKTIKELQKKNYDLSLEIAHLKGETTVHEEHVVVEHPSFMQRIRNNFV